MKAQLEKVIPDQDNSFKAFVREEPRFDGIWHYHPEIEIVLIEAGRGERFVGDNISPFQEFDLALLGTNLPHFWRSEDVKFKAGDPYCKAIVIQFLTDFPGKNFFDIPEFGRIKTLLSKANLGLSFSKKFAVQKAETVRQVALTQGWRRVMHLLDLLGSMSEETDCKPIASVGFSPHLNEHTNERIGKVMKFIFANYTRSLTLAEMAAQASMSPSAFCTFFRRITGKNLAKFINEIRINTACTLLRDTDRNVSEICFESGFNNLSNFNHFFKQAKGVSPRDYRNKIRK